MPSFCRQGRRFELEISGNGLVETSEEVEYVEPTYMSTLATADLKYALGSNHKKHLVISCGTVGDTIMLITGSGELRSLRYLSDDHLITRPYGSGWFISFCRGDVTTDVYAAPLIEKSRMCQRIFRR